MDHNKTSGRFYAAIFYPCMLAAVMLVGVMLFSPDGGIAASGSASADAYMMPSTHYITERAHQTAPSVTTSAAPPVTQISLRWSSAQLCDYMAEAAASADIGLKIDTVELEDPDRFLIHGTVKRDALTRMIENHTSDSRLLILTVRLLPDNISLEAMFTIACIDGSLKLTPNELSAAGIKLPVSLIPERVYADFSKYAQEALLQQGCSLDRLFISENTLYLDCTLSFDMLK
ncbi:MAG: hypothetical protein E7463_05430 [Ruminococcaceae bacterium]|nr:hypothetical protein [Oscillospiraceae bacterium]